VTVIRALQKLQMPKLASQYTPIARSALLETLRTPEGVFKMDLTEVLQGRHSVAIRIQVALMKTRRPTDSYVALPKQRAAWWLTSLKVACGYLRPEGGVLKSVPKENMRFIQVRDS
jgi:hypothetical protein